MKWFVYVLRCKDRSLYTGVTTDLDRRVGEHNNGIGSKYTKARLPVKLAYSEKAKDRSAAQSREAAIKKLSRGEKLSLIKIT